MSEISNYKGYNLVIPQSVDNHFGLDMNCRKFGVLKIDGLGGRLLPALHIRGNKTIENTENLKNYVLDNSKFNSYKNLNGKFFFGGIFSPHFGHFFSESIHRLKEYIDNQDYYDGLIFLPSPHRGSFKWLENLPSYIIFTLKEHFGLDINKINWILEPTLVKNLIIGKQNSSLGNHTDDTYIDFLSKFSSKYKMNYLDLDRVILARSNYMDMGRCLGVDYVFGKMNNFHVVNPETLGIEEQVSTIVNSKLLIVEEGSAIHLLDLIGYTEAKIIFISRRGSNKKYWERMYQNKCSEFYCFDDVIPIQSHFLGGPGTYPAVINLNKLEGFLQCKIPELKNNFLLDGEKYYIHSYKDFNEIVRMRRVINSKNLLDNFEIVFHKANSNS